LSIGFDFRHLFGDLVFYLLRARFSVDDSHNGFLFVGL
jgi:hypothetical protein